jgi:hypothetical protein
MEGVINILVLSTVLLCPQQHIDGLISQLAADSYQDREAATIELIRIGKPAIAEVKRVVKVTPDPEVRARCKIIIWEYYNVCDVNGNKPDIWKMPKKMSEEIGGLHGVECGAKHYSDLAEKMFSWSDASGNGFNWHQWKITINQMATQLMVCDLLDNFDKSRDEVERFLNRMSEVSLDGDEDFCDEF